MKAFLSLGSLLLCLATGLRAGTSANYSIVPEEVGALGGISSSTTYRQIASAGGIAGISSNPGGASARQGFVAQLFEVAGLVLDSPRLTAGENSLFFFNASLLYDDATLTLLPAASVAWSVLSGPLLSITPAGVASTGLVYENTPATVQGQFGAFTATINVTVANTHNDNYGTYAADGLDDAWQVQYFGLDQPQAAPGVDVNGTGQNNYFKFVAGLVPNGSPGAADARFTVTAQAVAGQPAQRQITFRPLAAGRNYRVQYSLSVGTNAVWNDLTGFLQLPDAGNARTIIDQQATDARRFYRVLITKDPSPPGPTRLVP